MTGSPASLIDWSRLDDASANAVQAMDCWTDLADRLGTRHRATLRLRFEYLARRDAETAEWVRIRNETVALGISELRAANEAGSPSGQAGMSVIKEGNREPPMEPFRERTGRPCRLINADIRARVARMLRVALLGHE